jgi:ferredoxin
MKVKIEQSKCIECGACAEVCPTVFKFKDGEKAKISEAYQSKGKEDTGIISELLKNCVSNASQKCPVNVINVI